MAWASGLTDPVIQCYYQGLSCILPSCPGPCVSLIERLVSLKVIGWVSTVVGAVSFLVHVQGMTENWVLIAFRELKNSFLKPQKVSSQISLAQIKPHYYF